MRVSQHRHDPNRGDRVWAPQLPTDPAELCGPGDRPLRVTAYLDRYVPFANAGGEWMLHHMLAPLAARGHTVRVLSMGWPYRDRSDFTIDGVHVCSEDSWAARVLGDTDVMVSHLGGTRSAVRAAAYLQIPLVYAFHNDETVGHWSLDPMNVTAAVFNTRWLQTATLRDYPQWAGVAQCVVRPPVPLGAYWVDGPAWDREFVTLVNPHPAKGSELFYELAEAMPGTRFLAVEGAYGQQRRPRKGKHPNVVWQRPTPNMRDDVYSRTRVLIVPSRYESFGRVAAEAMAAGIPVLAHPTAGLRECLGDAGVFVDRDRTAGWQGWLERLAVDRECFDHLATLGRARAIDAVVTSGSELLAFERLLAVAAAAQRGPVLSEAMAKHDPFRSSGGRRAHTVDVSGRPNGLQGDAGSPPALQGSTEAERAAEAGVTDPAVLEMAAAMDAAARGEAAPQLADDDLPAVRVAIIPADGGPAQLLDPPVVEHIAGEIPDGDLIDPHVLAEALGGTVIDDGSDGTYATIDVAGTDLEALVQDGIVGGAVEIDRPQASTPTPTEGVSDDDEDSARVTRTSETTPTVGPLDAAAGEGTPSPDGGRASSEPAPAHTEDASPAGDDTPAGDAPPRLITEVPKLATGTDGVVAWLVEEGISDAERFDRAEAAEWVENRRADAGKADRKAVRAAINPVLYVD